jgi:hypothetical protein
MDHPIKTKKHIKREPTFCSSMSQAEAVSGIPKDFQQWAKKQGCAAFKASRVFIGPLQAFYKEHSAAWAEESSDDGSQEAVNRERIKMLKKQQRKIDMEYQLASGELVRKADVLELQGKLIARWIDIIKRSVSKADWNNISKQFQAAPFETL